ncbi:hypothetical protein GF357_05170 [Candidatus Dojkabacteria bacterium]|nr:hypothetical protein [Candidatus Dojkabacteria bacterium]
MISAPHVFAHKRPALENRYKVEEEFTDKLARIIADRIPVYSVVSLQAQKFDPNFYSKNESPYKREISSIISRNKIDLMVDIHGLDPLLHYDFAIYYPLKYYKSMKAAKVLKDHLQSGSLRGSIVHLLNFPNDDGETLSEFAASQKKIPAVQLEVAKYIRQDDELLDLTAEQIITFLKSFS